MIRPAPAEGVVIDFSRRWTGSELMDDPDCDNGMLLRTVRQFGTINRLVSRYQAILTRHVLSDMAREPLRQYHLIDAGAGGCDIAVWLLRQARRKGLFLRVTAIDGDARIAAFAQANAGAEPGLTIVHADLMELGRFGPADYVFSNHVAHHLPDALIPEFIALMHRVAGRRWIVSDLHRSRFAFAAFQVFGRFFRDSFAFEDGKRSILRGFVPGDFVRYAEAAGLRKKVETSLMIPGRIIATARR